MIDDDSSDRILPPSERRRRQAKARGEVARSPELTAALVLLTTGGVLWFFARSSGHQLMVMLQTSLAAPMPNALTINSAVLQIHSVIRGAVEILAGVILIPLAGAVIANLVQTGWLWTPSALTPRIRRGSLVSWERSSIAMIRIAQLGVLVCITWRFLQIHETQLRTLGLGQLSLMLVVPANLICELLMQLSACLIAFAGVDYGLRFWRTERGLRMTTAERRQELREEGLRPGRHRPQAAFAGRQSDAQLTEVQRIVERDGDHGA